jgi:hypothetical protein
MPLCTSKLKCSPSQVSRWADGIQRPRKKEVIWEVGRILELSNDELDELLDAADYPARFPRHRASVLPYNSSPPEPLMNFKDELAAFEGIATGQDTQTRLISVHGHSGTGKSRLLWEYERVAGEQGLDLLAISLAQQLMIEDCLYQIVSRFGLQNFRYYDEFLAAGRPELTRPKEIEWHGQLTRLFFRDLGKYIAAPRLVLFFDQYEKADHAFKEWFTRIFLPGLFAQQPLIVVVAGQEKAELKAAGPGQRHFHLNGLSVDWFHYYATACNVSLPREQITLIHTVLGGRPKDYVDFVRAMARGIS